MSRQQTLWDTGSATSSPGSASGASPCASPDGLTIGPSGQAARPVNLSARQAKEQGLLTSGTSGPHSTGSSAGVALQSSLANRLAQATASLGSTLYSLTWIKRVTPAGRSIPALRASARRTSDSVFIGWATPVAANGGKESPRPNTPKPQLPWQASQAAWPTPTQQDQASSGSMNYAKTATHNPGVTLTDAARLTDSGATPNGSTAATTSGGQLNPVHSLWLQLGPFATAWARCAERVTPSTSRKPKGSYAPSSNVPDA